jgi:lambda family phage portal protein
MTTKKPINRLPDTFSESILPSWATKQLETSGTITALKGAYNSTLPRRRNMGWHKPGAGDADADSLDDLPELRAQSRDCLRKNPLAVGAVNTNITHVVGTGLRVQSRIDNEVLNMSHAASEVWQRNAEREWRSWAECLDCDINRGMNFYDYQRLVFGSVLESGDAFVPLLFKKLPTSHYGLKLQIFEADRVCNPYDAIDTVKITGGVGKDDEGTPEEYHIRTRHPGADTKLSDGRGRTWDSIKAFSPKGWRNIIHVYEKLRPGQTRGIPYLAPVIEMLHNLGKYTDAELQAAVISSYFTVFIETESGTGGMISTFESDDGIQGSIGDKDYHLGSGAVVGLAKGEKLSTANPGRPNTSFDAFVLSVSRQIGTALGLPFELLVQHFTKNFSAARSALLLAWKRFFTKRSWLVSHFCDIVYEAFVREAVLRGRLVAPGFLDDPLLRKAYLGNIWIGPAQGQIDPTKETKGARDRVAALFTTIDQETAALGGDFDQNIQQIKKEAKLKEELGIGTVVKEEIEDPKEEDDEDE